ncbi:MAG: effector-associated domain EAD1-containing protein [Ilumatobacteraceae bacterium]
MTKTWQPSVRWKADLRCEIVDVFTEAELSQLVSFLGLDFLKSTSAGVPYPNRVHELITRMSADGTIRALVEAVHQERPNDATITSLLEEMDQ